MPVLNTVPGVGTWCHGVLGAGTGGSTPPQLLLPALASVGSPAAAGGLKADGIERWAPSRAALVPDQMEATMPLLAMPTAFCTAQFTLLMLLVTSWKGVMDDAPPGQGGAQTIFVELPGGVLASPAMLLSAIQAACRVAAGTGV